MTTMYIEILACRILFFSSNEQLKSLISVQIIEAAAGSKTEALYHFNIQSN